MPIFINCIIEYTLGTETHRLLIISQYILMMYCWFIILQIMHVNPMLSIYDSNLFFFCLALSFVIAPKMLIGIHSFKSLQQVYGDVFV